VTVEYLKSGNTPDPVLITGRDLFNSPISADVAGWQCSVKIIDGDTHDEVSPPRAITETLNVDGIEWFLAKMLTSEAALMVNTFTKAKPKQYQWLITVSNETEDYNRSETRYLSVGKS